MSVFFSSVSSGMWGRGSKGVNPTLDATCIHKYIQDHPPSMAAAPYWEQTTFAVLVGEGDYEAQPVLDEREHGFLTFPHGDAPRPLPRLGGDAAPPNPQAGRLQLALRRRRRRGRRRATRRVPPPAARAAAPGGVY